MRIAVIGGAGYIGSHTCKTLRRAGYEPVVFDNLSTGHRHNIRWGEFVYGDIRDAAALNGLFSSFEIDAVMHFAALAYVGDSMKLPVQYYNVNVSGTINLVNTAMAHGVKRMVFSSSCATYGDPGTGEITEESVQLPINPYGRTKLIAEDFLRDVCKLGEFGAVALRYFNAAGADKEGEIGEEHDPEPHLIPNLLYAARDGRPVVINGSDYPTEDGTCIRDFVHVEDLATAHVSAVSRIDAGKFEAFNLGTGHGYSIREMVDLTTAVTGRNLSVQMGPRRAGDPPRLVANARKAAVNLEWTPQFSDMRTILETAWSWAQRTV